MFLAFSALVSWFILSAFAVLYASINLLFPAKRDDARLHAVVLLVGCFGLFGAPRVWFWMLERTL